MMVTEVSICSNALRRLGDDPITSLTDDTERARLCNAFYEDARDLTLRSHPWNFAIADYIFKIENDATNGRVLLTDESTAKILYIAKITNPTLFDSMFTETLTAKLSADLAYPITGSVQLQTQMEKLYRDKLSEARSVDGMEGFVDDFVSTTFTDFRT